MTDKELAKKQQAQVTRREEQPEVETFVPAADICETENQIVIRMDMPGVGKDNVDVRVDRDTLTVQGTVSGAPDGRLVYGEQRVGDFRRQFTLSDDLDRENIAATMDAGVLTLTIGKAEQVKPRKIEILPAT